MPELPEVETTRRSLLADVVGAQIVAVTVREPRLRRPVAADLAAQLRGRRVTAIDRAGKYLLFALDDGRTLLVHLGMSGSLCLTPPTTPLARHDHVVIALDRDRLLVFNDPRRFGLVRLGHRAELDELRALGPDPLAAAPPSRRPRTRASSPASATSTPTRRCSPPARARAAAPAS